MIGCIEVLVVAISDALEVEKELSVRKALIEAHLGQVLLRRLNVLHFVILIHYGDGASSGIRKYN